MISCYSWISNGGGRKGVRNSGTEYTDWHWNQQYWHNGTDAGTDSSETCIDGTQTGTDTNTEAAVLTGELVYT